MKNIAVFKALYKLQLKGKENIEKITDLIASKENITEEKKGRQVGRVSCCTVKNDCLFVLF